MNTLSQLIDIIDSRKLSTVFQPVIDISERRLVGYEALSRGPRLSPLENPVALFDAAAQYGLLWDLEYVTRLLAIEKAAGLGLDGKLFLNVDPRVIHDNRFNEGCTFEMLRRNGFKPSQVIFEITERTAIEDYWSFRRVLGHYTRQGYGIAIDDVGAGHSGMRTIAETNPKYIKLDMSLVRDVHTDRLKQAICRSMVELCRTTGMQLVAEGVESLDEFMALKQMDIYLMQGYLFGKPSATLQTYQEAIQFLPATLLAADVSRRNQSVYSIGRLARHGVVIDSRSNSKDALEMFKSRKASSAVVIDSGRPIGLIMASFLSGLLSSPFGYSLSLNRSVKAIMDEKFMLVDYGSSLITVARDAMERDEKSIYDHIVVTKNGLYHGVVTIKDLILKLGEFNIETAKRLNPLTGLPGNTLIENELLKLSSCDTDACVLYCDIDRFKVYNDTHGFEMGDKVILFTAEVICSVLTQAFGSEIFIGHIGGDDFIAILPYSYQKIQEACEAILTQFDSGIMRFISKDKGGRRVIRTPSLSIAVLAGDHTCFVSPESTGKEASDLKKECKKNKRSCFITKDLRSKDVEHSNSLCECSST